MNKNVIIVIILILLAAGGWLIFHRTPVSAPTTTTGGQTSSAPQGETGDTGGGQPAATSATVNVGVSAGAGASSVREFTVTGKNFAFSPSEIKVKKGDTVKITFKNSGGFHDFKIDEFHVGTKRINGGEEETVQFVADKSGTFEYYCSVGTHRQMGMRGNLIVE